MAIYLGLGSPDQRGWIYLTGTQTADGRDEVLIKPGVALDAHKLEVLNELMGAQSAPSRIAGTG